MIDDSYSYITWFSMTSQINTNQYKSYPSYPISKRKNFDTSILEGTWMNRGWGTFGGYSGNPSLLSISCTKCMVLRLVPGRVWEGRPGVLLSQPFLGEKKTRIDQTFANVGSFWRFWNASVSTAIKSCCSGTCMSKRAKLDGIESTVCINHSSIQLPSIK